MAIELGLTEEDIQREEQRRAFATDPVTFAEQTTTFEDKEAVADVAAALQRTAVQQQKDIPGSPQITFADPRQLRSRSEEIAKAIEAVPGDEITLGLARTATSFATTAAGVGNVLFGIYDEKQADKYNKKFESYRKADNGYIMSYFKTLGDMYDDATGKEGFLPSEGKVMKSMIDYFAGKPVVTEREALELTRFGRPEASVVEQGIRLIPEVAGFSAASIKLMLRNRKEIVSAAEEFLKKEKGSDFNLKDATNEDIVNATRSISDEKKMPFLRAVKLERPVRPFYEERVALTLQMERLGGFRGASKKLYDNNRKIREARKRRSEAEAGFLKTQKQSDKDLIDQENRIIAGLKSERRDFIPAPVVGVVASEALASVGATTAGNLFGEDNTVAVLLGALGGGILGPLSLNKLISLGDSGAKTLGLMTVSVGNKLGALSDEQLNLYLERGTLGVGTNLSTEDRKVLKDFSEILQLLPPDQRFNYVQELKNFDAVRAKLAAIEGIDPELLETTLGNAMNLLPLMLMRQSVADAAIDMASGPKGVINADLIELISSTDKQDELIGSLRSGLDTLASQVTKAGAKDPDVDRVITSLQDIATTSADTTRSQKEALTSTIEEIQSVLTQPLIAETFDNLEDYKGLLTQAAESAFVKSLPQTQRDRVQEAITSLGEAAEARQAGVTQYDSQIRAAVKRFGNTFEEGINVAATDNAVNDFTTKAETFKASVLGIGRAKFNELKGVDVDVTDWFESLYRNAEVGEPDSYTSIIKRGEPLLNARVAGTVLRKAVPLEKLADYKAKSNADEVLRDSAELREEFREAFEEAQFYVPDGFGGMRSVEADEINYSLVKAFINKTYGRSSKENLSDFDTFQILKGITDNAGINVNLRLMMDAKDIQDFSSSFSTEAAKLYDSNRGLSNQYSTLAKSIVETMPDELSGELRDAKKYWLENVIDRYRDKENSPIGYWLDHTKGNNYVKNPSKWVDIKKILRLGTERDGVELEDQLARVFGFRNEQTGKFEIAESEKPVVNNLLTNMLSEYLGSTPAMQKAKRLGDITPEGTAKIGGPEQAAFAAVGQRAQKMGALTKNDLVVSDAMNYLQRKGLIDRQAAIDYNTNIDRFIGTTEFKNNLEKLNTDVKRSAKKLGKQVDLAEKYLNDVFQFSSEFQAKKISSIEELFDFFVTSPQAARRIDELVPKIAKNLNISNEESRKTLSDLVLDAISKRTYSTTLDLKDFEKGVKEGTYKTVKDFKYNEFHDIVKQNETILKKLLDGGEEGATPVYDGVMALADFLRVINRNEAAVKRAAGVRVASPRGLSVESLLSRGYSIIRGVVSPKYVASEIALRAFRQKNANALAKLASDPKMVDAVIQMIELGDTAIRKYNANLYPVLVAGLGQALAAEGKGASKKQMIELELDQFKLGGR